MRPIITLFMVLLIGSMLVTTAFAECAAMNMPCCAQHNSTNCHEVCAAPTGNTNNGAVPQFAGELQAIAITEPALPVPHLLAKPIQPTFTRSVENLLTRIHILLI